MANAFIIKSLINKIKQKKELVNLQDNFIEQQLQQILCSNPKLKIVIKDGNERSSDYKQLVKLVRAKLRKQYGLFQAAKNNNLSLLVNRYCKDLTNQQALKEILSSHASTKERWPYYSQLYSKLFALSGNPKTIIDLGCGVNPFSILFMPKQPQKYYAYDINSLEIKLINRFLKTININGKVEVKDITKLSSLPEAEVAFLFKVTDIIDRGRGHKPTEQLLKMVPAKWVIISFPTLTMSGKPMNAPRRRWVEWLCQRLGYSFKIVEIPNEIFYVIEK